MVLEDCIKN